MSNDKQQQSNTPEARKILKNLGVGWPLTLQPLYWYRFEHTEVAMAIFFVVFFAILKTVAA